MSILSKPNHGRIFAFAAIAAAAVIAVIGLGATDALANNVFTNLETKSKDLFYNIRTVVLILCALAIIVTMATAISGRFPVTKALAICGAILVIGMASQIVTYFAGATTNAKEGSNVPSMQDTSGAGSQ